MSVRLEHDWFPGTLPENVYLGPRTWLYSSFAFRHYRSRQGLRVGADTGLYDGTLFDLGPDAEVRIGRYTTLVGAILCTNGRVDIGNYVFIAHEVALADAPVAIPASDRTPFSAGPGGRVSDPVPGAAAGIAIGDDVWIGARAIVLGGARIGNGAIIGAAAVVNGEVPPYAVFAGNPGRVVAVRAPSRTVPGR